MSGLQWRLHFHSPLVHSRGTKSPLQIFLLAFHFLWKSLMKQYVTFYRILRFFDSYCFRGRSWLFHLTLLFLVQKHNFDLWPFFASFPDKLLSKTFGNKNVHIYCLTHLLKRILFFFFDKLTDWLNMTTCFTDLVMILVFISAPMGLPWSVLIDAPHTCSLVHHFLLSVFTGIVFLTTGQGKVAWEMRPKCSHDIPKPE